MALSDAPVRSTAEESTRRAELGGLDVLTWPLFEGTALRALVTTRHGGVSRGPFGSLNLALHVGDDDEAVVENRRRALGALGGRLEELVVAEQVHGTTVTVVASEAAGRGSRSLLDAVPGTDALVTHGPGLTLAVLVADCAPVVLFDPHAAVVGCAHAGWRGALGGVIEATIEAMGSLGARPERLLVGVGPAIAGQRYEVGDEVADAARRHLGPHPRCLSADSGGRWRLDLAGALTTILTRAGVPGSQVAVADDDTGPKTPFFSARAAQPCGRFGLLARIEP
jgi:YfiH family protein